MITRKAFILTVALSSTVLLAGCTSANTVNDPGVPSRSASAGVPSVAASGSAAPSAVPTATSSAQGGDITVQTPTTGGDDQRAAELVVMSYFDNLLTGDQERAQRLIDPNASSAAEDSAEFAKRIIREKLVSYRISGQEINPKNGETIVRIHYSTRAKPGDNVTEFGADEDKLESEWFVSTLNPEAFR